MDTEGEPVTEMIYREVKGGTETKCSLKENQSEFSETRRRLFADEAHVPGACPRANRRTDRRCACATVDFGRDRRSDEAGPT